MDERLRKVMGVLSERPSESFHQFDAQDDAVKYSHTCIECPHHGTSLLGGRYERGKHVSRQVCHHLFLLVELFLELGFALNDVF